MWIKSILLSIAGLFLAALVALIAMIGIANYGVGARELTDEDDLTDWMAGLDDEAAINELYIPGTHDSGALHSLLGISGKCQSYDIGKQLHFGVRLFDIRLQLRDDNLAIVHSFVDQKLSFEAVLDEIKSFLEENPTEFIIISIKEDADAENSTLAFEGAVENMLRTKLGSLLSESTAVPKTVGEARGKVHVISRYASSSLGVPANSGWQDSTWFELGELFVQDYYAVSGIEAKMASISVAFSRAHVPKYALVLNFTSCYLEDGFPPAHAPTTAKKINPQLADIIASGKAAPCAFLIDFITPELSRSIVELNFE